MLKVKPHQPRPVAGHATSVARHVDEAAAADRSIRLQIDDLPPLTVDDPRARRLLWRLVEHIEAVETVQEALEQIERGEGVPFDEAMDRIRERYAIPRK